MPSKEQIELAAVYQEIGAAVKAAEKSPIACVNKLWGIRKQIEGDVARAEKQYTSDAERLTTRMEGLEKALAETKRLHRESDQKLDHASEEKKGIVRVAKTFLTALDKLIAKNPDVFTGKHFQAARKGLENKLSD